MAQQVETVIIGGGQAGLATSYYLRQQGHEHIVLEKSGAAGSAWRSRWDSFTLVTPNWMLQMPGAEYTGDKPDGFLSRKKTVRYFEEYVEQFKLPVHFGVTVSTVESIEKGYCVTAEDAVYEARNVVVATGLYQHPKLPPFSANITPAVTQLHSGQYRNADSLPPGAVLVVGTAQSGCQIAEELYQSGRKVYLCVGSTGRAPRRYRGKDCFYWLDLIHFLDRTPDKLPSPAARFAGNPHTSGKGGGHNLNLHQFTRDGVVLLGRIQGADNGKISLAGDLKENLTKCDQFEARLIGMIDGAIQQNGLDAPEETLPQLRDGYDAPLIESLDLEAEGISTIIWAMGYTFNFDMVKLPLFDDFGYPVQQRGVTAYPGLYFMGLPWLHTQKSGLIAGVGKDAAYIASDIVNNRM
jgi:putative flavoprotein involved in K+ transport